MAYLSALCGFSGLLRSFLGIQHRPTLVLSTLGAGAMGKLLLVAVRALGNTRLSQEVVGAAVGGAARGVAPFRIRHDAIPFAFSPSGPHLIQSASQQGGTPQNQCFVDFILLRNPESASQRGSV
jgi:hypothetical protein